MDELERKLWLPATTIVEMDRAEANLGVDSFVAEVRGAATQLVEMPTLDGARRSTAAAFLLRSVVLVEQIRSSGDNRHLAELGLRTVLELTLRGRYLLVGPHAKDEFDRMRVALLKAESKHAKHFGTPPPGLPVFLQVQLPPKAKQPRNLFNIASGMDEADSKEAEAEYSARQLYRNFYAPLSETSTHGSLQSVKRGVFMEHPESILRVLGTPPPMLESSNGGLIAAGCTGNLALDVWRAFGLDDSPIRDTGVRLP